jgi:hypothetical protein
MGKGHLLLGALGLVLTALLGVGGMAFQAKLARDAEVAETNRQRIEARRPVCEKALASGQSYWSDIVNFSRNAQWRGKLPDEQVMNSLKGFEDGLREHYLVLRQIPAEARVAFEEEEVAAFELYFEAVRRAQLKAAAAMQSPASAWPSDLVSYFEGILRTGRQKTDRNFVRELLPICQPYNSRK